MKRYVEASEDTKTHIMFDSEEDFNLFRTFMRNHGYLSNWKPNDLNGFGADIDSFVMPYIQDAMKQYKIHYK